jgi:hypothetical protein
VGSLSRLLDPAAAARATGPVIGSSAGPAALAFTEARPLGGVHALGGLWRRLGIDAAVGRGQPAATPRGSSGSCSGWSRTGLWRRRRSWPRPAGSITTCTSTASTMSSTRRATRRWTGCCSSSPRSRRRSSTPPRTCWTSRSTCCSSRDTTSVYFETDEPDGPVDRDRAGRRIPDEATGASDAGAGLRATAGPAAPRVRQLQHLEPRQRVERCAAAEAADARGLHHRHQDGEGRGGGDQHQRAATAGHHGLAARSGRGHADVGGEQAGPVDRRHRQHAAAAGLQPAHRLGQRLPGRDDLVGGSAISRRPTCSVSTDRCPPDRTALSTASASGSRSPATVTEPTASPPSRTGAAGHPAGRAPVPGPRRSPSPSPYSSWPSGSSSPVAADHTRPVCHPSATALARPRRGAGWATANRPRSPARHTVNPSAVGCPAASAAR